jgi:hypothetical protein
VVNAEIARHPTKPVLVEVSADGPPVEKAAWLERMVAAVQAEPQVFGLLYHEGSPDVRATPAEDTQWSMESDDLSLAAVRTWQALAPSASPPCQSAPQAHTELGSSGAQANGSNQPNSPTQPQPAVGALPSAQAARDRHAGR